MAIRTYKVTLDTKNSIAPEPVFLRQGDKTGAVVIDATLMDNGAPVSLEGLTPMFKANTADGQAVIADSTGFNIVNASSGEFTYQVPSQLGSVDGKIKIAYFSLSDSSGTQSTFNVVFVVEKAADMTKESAKDWASNLNKIIEQYNQWVNNAHSGWEDFVNENKEIIESIDPGGTLLTEVIAARNGKSNLKTRLDDEHAQVTNQLAEISDKAIANSAFTNVLSLGVKNDGSEDCTEVIHNALNLGKSLFFPTGTYLLDHLELKPDNVLIGENEHNTILKPNISASPAFIYICKGPVNNVTFERFGIAKGPNSGQIGIDIRANFPDEGYQHGGLWDSCFKNIYLTVGIESQSWDGIGMRISGSGANSMLPIQLNIFEKINIWSNNKLNIQNVPLIIEGQVEQNLFSRCTFSGVDANKSLTDLQSASAIFRRRRTDTGIVEGDSGGGPNTFIQCYFGNNPLCLSFERSGLPTFINCFYENARQFINIKAVASANIIGGVFGNVVGDPNLILSDFTGNRLLLTNIMLQGNISCQGANMVACSLKNRWKDEVATTSNTIKFTGVYSIVHLNHTENEITITNIIPSRILITDKNFYLEIVVQTGKTVLFSKLGGNLYNDMTLNTSGRTNLIKVSYIPYVDKYTVELFDPY